MKITDVRSTSVRVPLRVPAKWSGGTRLTAPAILVEIETDEGLVGLGECVGPTLPTIHTVLDKELKPFLVGADPMRQEFLLHQMEEFTVNYADIAAYAIAGVDIALWDLKGKALNTPVANLLGGVYRPTTNWMGYLFIEEPALNAEQALAYVREGYDTLKIKVGRDVDEDVRRLKAIREAVGWDVHLRVDANMAWSRSTAVRAINQLSEFRIQYCEQPIPWHDVEGMASIARQVSVPLAADEGVTGVRSALKLIEARAVEVFVLYISEAGGLTRARDIVHLADQAGVACVTGTWAELGVGTAAAAHLVGSSRNFQMANDTHYSMQDDDILTEMLPLKGGRMPLPTGPGLGVELDPEKVARFHNLEAREAVFYDHDNPDWIPRIGQLLR